MALRLIGLWAPPLSSARAHELVDGGARLVDVREPDEFARGHLPGAVNMPVDAIEEHLDNLAQGASVLYCQSGLRSQRAWQVLTRRHGLTQVHNLGGMTRW